MAIEPIDVDAMTWDERRALVSSLNLRTGRMRQIFRKFDKMNQLAGDAVVVPPELINHAKFLLAETWAELLLVIENGPLEGDPE